MKISKIEIKNFQQFKDFSLDLTYPKGHVKEGQPLDKVCFIGQSGTGKTTLLELLIHGYFFGSSEKLGYKTKKFDEEGYSVTSLITKDEKYRIVSSLDRQGFDGNFELFKTTKQKVYYFPFTNLIFDSFEEDLKNIALEKVPKQLKDFYKFDIQGIKAIWKTLYHEVEDYKRAEINFRVQLSKKAEIEEVNIKKAMRVWRKENPNPLKHIADNCLDKVLNQFQLKVKTDIDSVKELNTILIQSKIDNSLIPYENLSTGTKDFMFTALPLFAFEPKDALILIDQPEASLYPDIQRQIIQTYTSFGENCQFFFATHSPVIASSFEPWEIVELVFEQDGYVGRRLYYEGENHVDNYVIDPRYLRWDSLLEKMFGIEEEGNEKYRLPKLMEIAALESRIKQMNGNPQKKELWEKYQKLAALLDWKIN